MDLKSEWRKLAALIAAFVACYWLPVGWDRFDNAMQESLLLVRWYAREHVILCLIPAFFIAGAIAVFISQASVLKYLGAKANKVVAYGVASVSGTLLAVCSCTVLPLFAGIYRLGAGLGPACAFLYSGPAINILAIVLTMTVLGAKMGIARAVGAIVFSIVIGLLMHLIFRHEDDARGDTLPEEPSTDVQRPLWKNALYFASMAGILVFVNWGQPQTDTGLWHAVWAAKWWTAGILGLALALILWRWFQVSWRPLSLVVAATVVAVLLAPQHPQIPFIVGVIGLSIVAHRSNDETAEWLGQSWGFAKQILPLLLIGVVLAGGLLGRPGHEGLIPSSWIAQLVGGNSLRANLVASVLGAFMYFATLTEVPILQALIGAGMGPGPALALLLAGPALSLPNMLVIRTIMGTKKTVVFVLLVIILSTTMGVIYGAFIA